MQHLHRPKIIKDTKEGIVNICEICKKKLILPKDVTGRINNKKYLEFNKANFVQPFGRTGNLYRRIHGTPNPKDFEYTPKHVARQQAEKGWDELGKQSLKSQRELI